MNTILDILNILKHLLLIAISLLFATCVDAFACLAYVVNIPFLWVTFLFFLLGFWYYCEKVYAYYTRNWLYKGHFWKSLWYLLRRR